ncbi:hypothetical protein [Hydrococcus rivularis]|uniref:hypothetical protein n=1 Tax=Hydrococcus rivularis TaxID=1616834 RepID=UPI001115047E|nr:hypothetical protein [Hydrococcus rivularis]
MTEIVDRPHPLPLSQIGRGEKNVDRENIKIGMIPIDNCQLFHLSSFVKNIQSFKEKATSIANRPYERSNTCLQSGFPS